MGASNREVLDVVGKTHEEDDENAGGPRANRNRCDQTDCHQRVRGHPAVARGAQNGTKDRIAACRNRGNPDRPGDVVGQTVEQSQPFGKDDEEHNRPENSAEQREKLVRKGDFRIGRAWFLRLSRCCRAGLSGPAAAIAHGCHLDGKSRRDRLDGPYGHYKVKV